MMKHGVKHKTTKQVTQESKEEEKNNMEYKTPIKKINEFNMRTKKIDFLKCKILEEELE